MKLLALITRRVAFRQYSTKPVPLIYSKLSHRSLLRIRGNDTLQFLQGVVTNDTRYLSKSMDNNRPSLFAMMLNTQGRLLYDLILYVKDEASEQGKEDVYVECDRSVLEEVIKQFKFYRLRRKLEIQSCDKEENVYALFPKLDLQDDSQLVAPTSPQINRDQTSLFCADPRVALLGFRAVVPADKDAAKIFPAEEISEDAYRVFRYQLGVAEGCFDMPPGAAFPLEANGDYMNGVSFHKGCYIGQELTARTHHTGVVRKRLMPLKFECDASNVRINAKIVDEKGNNLGKFRRAIQKYGLGLLYVHEALSAKSMHVQTDDGESISCRTVRPVWWESGAKLNGEIRGFHSKTDDTKEQDVG